MVSVRKSLRLLGWDERAIEEAPPHLLRVADCRVFSIDSGAAAIDKLEGAEAWTVVAHPQGDPLSYHVRQVNRPELFAQLAAPLGFGRQNDVKLRMRDHALEHQYASGDLVKTIRPSVRLRTKPVTLQTRDRSWFALSTFLGLDMVLVDDAGEILVGRRSEPGPAATDLDRYVHACALLCGTGRQGWGVVRRAVVAALP